MIIDVELLRSQRDLIQTIIDNPLGLVLDDDSIDLLDGLTNLLDWWLDQHELY